MGKIEKYWPQDEIIKALQDLPKDKPINKKSLIDYHKQGLICGPDGIARKFGSIKEACKQAGVRCDALYGKEHIKHITKLNIKWNKEKVIKAVKSVEGNFINIKEYEKLAKKNKKLPHRETIKRYLKTKTIHEAFKIIGVKYKSHYWSNKRIIKALQRLYQQHGPFPRTHINKKFLKRKECCGANVIRGRFGSLDKVAQYAGIHFCNVDMKGNGAGIFTRIGKQEKEILDQIEIENNSEILRQYQVNRKFVDGYDPINNIAYEIDEPNHKYQKIQDIIRENKIKDILGCGFVRIPVA